MNSPLQEADLAQVGDVATPSNRAPRVRLASRVGAIRRSLAAALNRLGRPIGLAADRVRHGAARTGDAVGRTTARAVVAVRRPVSGGLGRIGRLTGRLIGKLPAPIRDFFTRIGRVVAKAANATVRLGRRFATWKPLYGVIAAAVVVLGSVLSGAVQGTDATFVVMGFDPDRAQLITTLIICAIAAAAATLVVYRPIFGATLGTIGVGSMFGPTFVTETRNALAATGALGSFDLGGWIMTLLTLVVIGFVSAWAGATLAAAVRPSLIATGANIVEMVKARRPSRAAAGRPLAAVLILALLAVTGPVFNDMVNLAPDSLMLNGGNFVPLAPGNATPVVPVATVQATPTPAATPTPSSSSSELAIASPTPEPTAHASPGTKPWLAWKPSGAGKVTRVDFFAPWNGGTADTVDVNIYTPAGYDSDPTRRYPVLYEAPTGLDLWGKGTGAISALDQLISSGEMPASIVVFINSSGAVYPDSQCADSYDHKMWLETFISKTVVEYLDTHYQTIKDPNARGIMGMSAGGFCAAMLLTRHPDVYSTAISFSGYYWAGNGSAAARDPYGGNQAEMDAVSPGIQAAFLSAELRQRLFYIVIASPTQAFYSVQADLFEKVLKDNGVGFDPIKSVWEHGWTQVRNDFPEAVKAWSARMVVDGVF
jgi:enterochelin esterase-like enzyme